MWWAYASRNADSGMIALLSLLLRRCKTRPERFLLSLAPPRSSLNSDRRAMSECARAPYYAMDQNYNHGRYDPIGYQRRHGMMPEQPYGGGDRRPRHDHRGRNHGRAHRGHRGDRRRGRTMEPFQTAPTPSTSPEPGEVPEISIGNLVPDLHYVFANHAETVPEFNVPPPPPAAPATDDDDQVVPQMEHASAQQQSAPPLPPQVPPHQQQPQEPPPPPRPAESAFQDFIQFAFEGVGGAPTGNNAAAVTGEDNISTVLTGVITKLREVADLLGQLQGKPAANASVSGWEQLARFLLGQQAAVMEAVLAPTLGPEVAGRVLGQSFTLRAWGGGGASGGGHVPGIHSARLLRLAERCPVD